MQLPCHRLSPGSTYPRVYPTGTRIRSLYVLVNMQTASMQRTVTARSNAFSTLPAPRRVAGSSGRRQLHIQNAVKDVFMPALSSTMTEGKIVSWLKNVGDKISKGEPIVVVESDKADMDVESFSDGILGAIVCNEGERASVGSAIAFIAETEAEVDEAKKKAGASTPAATAAPPAGMWWALQ